MSQLKKLIGKGLKERIGNMGPRSKLALLLKREGVRKTSEYRRILEIPRRTWSEADAQRVSKELTEFLAEPDGGMTLWGIQGMALKEMYEMGGLFGPIAVGGGKTLLTFLAPTVVEAKRPLLLIPASLRKKTERRFKELERHWWGRASQIRLMHYEMLSSEKGMKQLRDLEPDMIMADECHRLKNKTAARTKRMIRYMDDRPETMFVGVSGTITNRTLKDYQHILEWCLPNHCPLPVKWNMLVGWCQAVDEKVAVRMAPGALEGLYNEVERKQANKDELAAVRSAVRRRVTETPGVVATSDVKLGCSLRIDEVHPEYPKQIDALFHEMRETWQTPFGEPIADPVAMWRHCQELALGFTYRWDPPAPPEWLEARKLWSQCCRHILKNNRKELDSELPVINSVLRGEYDGKILYVDGMMLSEKPVDQVLAEWREIKPIFKPNSVPVWWDDTALRFAADWMDRNKGLCWVSHVAFGKKLAETTGRPYFQQKGVCKKNKTEIEQWKSKDGSVIVSIASNKDGRNLQHQWSKSLVMAPMSQGLSWEQLLGRTHRPGQPEDEVVYTVYLGCLEMVGALEQSVADAKNIEAGQQRQKLLYADLCVDFESAEFARGPRWVRGSY